MSRGMKRATIPVAYRDLSTWPTPDIHVMSDSDRAYYLRRRTAVEMYSDEVSFQLIRDESDLSEDEVRRTVKRCVSLDADGRIVGFFACIKGYRTIGYKRSAEVAHSKFDGSGGCAGALRQLFDRFPDVELLVTELFLGKDTHEHIGETRTPIVKIHNQFKIKLREFGLTDNDWPFNTKNCGYKSIAKYCQQLFLDHTQQAVRGRSGIDAARRGPVGRGIAPILPRLRPFSAVQLDFHKIDAASIIVITNEFGREVEVPLARWHIGLAAEEYSGAVIGAYVALETTPSGDSTLEILDSALRPDARECDNLSGETVKLANTLLRQLMPEMTYQCFSVLKVDNGTSNVAHEVVNNVMDVVGCAVNFGPTYSWWRRDLIERIFGQLTRSGLQRAPSTHGTGPGDVRVEDPNGKAIGFRILLSELIDIIYREIRSHNTRRSEGLNWSSPLECVQAALSNPRSGLFVQPLPKTVQRWNPLLQHAEVVTVRGNLKRNERPYFVIDRWRYTNASLANSFDLIGQKLLTYTDRRLCRVVHATVLETGEQLGQMSSSGWRARSGCSWRDRKLLNRMGMSDRNTEIFDDPIHELKQKKAKELSRRRPSKRKHSSTDALTVARLPVTKRRGESPQTAATQPVPIEKPRQSVAQPTANMRGDPFGLTDVLPLQPIKRRG